MVVRGATVGQQTQCVHYHSARDIVAIRFKCCDTFYACVHCHEELTDHRPLVWGKDERESPAVLCGKCQNTLSIAEYLNCGSLCPFCGAAFNPDCERHYDCYF